VFNQSWSYDPTLFLTLFLTLFWRFLLLLQTQIQIQTPQNLLQPKILLNRKVSVMSGDTKMKNVLDFLHKGSSQKIWFWFLRNLQNFPQTQTQAQEALNMLQSKSLLNRKVSGHPKDTRKKNVLDFFQRGPFLENSLFFEDFDSFSPNTNPGPGCSKPAPIKNYIK